jgi:uncharacterized membrane protein
VGREKNIEAEVYNAFYGGQWMKLSIFNPNSRMKNLMTRVLVFFALCIVSLNFYKLSRVLWFVIHGVKYKNYKEHRVLETSSLVTL